MDKRLLKSILWLCSQPKYIICQLLIFYTAFTVYFLQVTRRDLYLHTLAQVNATGERAVRQTFRSTMKGNYISIIIYATCVVSCLDSFLIGILGRLPLLRLSKMGLLSDILLGIAVCIFPVIYANAHTMPRYRDSELISGRFELASTLEQMNFISDSCIPMFTLLILRSVSRLVFYEDIALLEETFNAINSNSRQGDVFEFDRVKLLVQKTLAGHKRDLAVALRVLDNVHVLSGLRSQLSKEDINTCISKLSKRLMHFSKVAQALIKMEPSVESVDSDPAYGIAEVVFSSWEHVFSFQPAWTILLFVLELAQVAVGPVSSILLGKLVGEAQAATSNHRTATYESFAWAYLAVMILGFWCSYYFSVYVQSVMISRAATRLQNRIVQITSQGTSAFWEKHSEGELTVSFNCIQLLANAVWIGVSDNLFVPAISLCVSLVIAGITDINFMLATLGFLPLIFFNRRPVQKGAKSARKFSTLYQKVGGKYQNIASISPIIRANDASTFVSRKFEMDTHAEMRKRWKTLLLSTCNVQVMYWTIANIYTALLTLGLVYLVLKDAKTISQYVTYTGIIATLVKPIINLGLFSSSTLSNAGVAQALDNILYFTSSDAGGNEKEAAQALQPLCNCIEMKDLRFKYASSSPEILKGVNLTIRAGSSVVLCGASGSGKSTLLNILLRFVPASSVLNGSITFDGMQMHEYSLKSFRKQVSVVFQHTMILEGTVKENIAFGSGASDKDVEEAARQSEIHDFIIALPEKYNTTIGARGNFSGGSCSAFVLHAHYAVNPLCFCSMRPHQLWIQLLSRESWKRFRD